MRRFVTLCVILLVVCTLAYSIHDQQNISLSVTYDVMTVDALWRDHVRFRFSGGLLFSEGIGFEIPITCIMDRSGGDEILFDFSLRLLVHPWGTGPFIGFSLAQMVVFTGAHVPHEPVHYFNESVFGYTWEFAPGWFVRPSIIYRDPAESAPESFAYVSGLVPSWSRLQFSLDVGWIFASIAPDGSGGPQ